MGKRFLVTGGAGFIGSAFVRHAIATTDYHVLVVDKLTYAGNLDSLATVRDDPRFRFLRADIADAEAMKAALSDFRPDVILHLAAESHVDRSIEGPATFVQTNVVGTFVLLQQALAYWRTLAKAKAAAFRFHHVSTDEVFGSLDAYGQFSEESPLSAQLAVLGVEGGLRSFGARLASHLRPAVADFELFEQFWSVSLSGKAHSPDDP